MSRQRQGRGLRRRIAPVVHVLARVGCVSIGTVYVLIGVWALLALLRVARPAADEQRILHMILHLPLGRLLIAAIAAGTTGYILWLIFEAVGYGGRCAILIVFAEFLGRAAYTFDPRAVGDTDAAFDALSLSGGLFGHALFSAVALGTVAYGAVMYVNAVSFDFGEE